jgi:cell division protein FtsI/penicillin-binding protein 2
MNSNFVPRIRFVLGVVCLFALIIIIKLFIAQIVNGKTYSERADKQYVKKSESIFDRGSIFFESKEGVKIGAATVKEGYILAINPKILKDPEVVYETISSYISLDKKVFLDKASKTDDPYEELQKKLDVKIGESLASLKIPGLIVTKDSWRVYPGDSLASQSIGIVGYDSQNKIAGRYGLERYYEDVLSRSSQTVHTNFFAEIFAGIKDTFSSEQIKNGDIVSSVEPGVENYLEKILQETKNKWKSDSIGGIIMDPNTGEIYAMASAPSFNPNDLKEIKDPKVFSNPLVEDVREMGSIIKPLTIAVGLDSGAITPNFSYDDTGFMELNTKKISNYDGKARGKNTPLQQILSQSLNIGAATVALQTGHEEFAKYFKDFGFGDVTGIDQPNEQKGIVKNLDSKRDIELATASYGQGIAMSPIETVRALAILANGGKLVTPHLVKKIEYIDGTNENVNTNAKQVIKKETSEEVTRMLIKVVDEALKKGQVKMAHYSIAAKTGTAQIADHANGGYYEDRYLHSFFGYFPAYNPKFIVFLYHVYPKNVEYASETLTDPFIQITKFLINYYEIPPDR